MITLDISNCTREARAALAAAIGEHPDNPLLCDIVAGLTGESNSIAMDPDRGQATLSEAIKAMTAAGTECVQQVARTTQNILAAIGEATQKGKPPIPPEQIQ
jgi:hypothetical protein